MPEPYVAEVQVVFRHQQNSIPGAESTVLARVSWLKPSPVTPLLANRNLWNKFPELGVETWLLDEYAESGDANFPPNILPLASIHCQAARGRVDYTKPPLWITTTMDRVICFTISTMLKPYQIL
ncbi:hypothetical protein R3P38DRAFT_2800089 [Favolaschia claudopus]|uniref:Uncharacterized protein n=1 Tax=Favolaschia claudopus TaxID=2862362 RepID=A0AAV9ZZD4_9AGAR